MPYRTATERVQKYSKAVIPDNVRAKFEAELSDMIAKQQAAQAELCNIEEQTRQILDSAGVVANYRILYLNFARALFKAKGRQKGEAFIKSAQAEMAKFTALGCDPAILNTISTTVFGAVLY